MVRLIIQFRSLLRTDAVLEHVRVIVVRCIEPGIRIILRHRLVCLSVLDIVVPQLSVLVAIVAARAFPMASVVLAFAVVPSSVSTVVAARASVALRTRTAFRLYISFRFFKKCFA